ncbi:MAG: hypothetical protein K2Y37_06865 [Pirellulales bacterium]|nr:hypothetical protein [Pirellulales bacterium]
MADAPEYFWGWNRLAEWYFDNGAREPFLAAARKLVELEPDYAVSHGNLAAALMRMADATAEQRSKHLADAQRALERSVQLDADYLYGHAELFDLCLANDDLATADIELVALARLEPDAPNTLSRRAQLAAARGDLTTGGAALMQLLKQPLPYAWPLDTALAALEKLPHGRVVCEGLLGAAASQEADPPEQVVRSWVGLCQRTHGWGTCVRRLRRWRGSEAAYKTAADELLILMGKNSVATLLRWFVWRNRRRLAADNHLWARVGWALINHRRNHAARRWLADWQGRADLDTWPLLLVAIALQADGRADEAVLANRRALERPRDEFSARHAALLAGEELVAGRTAAARALLPPVDELRGHDYYEAVARLVGAALQIAEEFAAGTRTSSTAARRRLAIAVREAPADFGRDQPFDLLWHRLLWRIASDQGLWWLAAASRLRVALLRVEIALRR